MGELELQGLRGEMEEHASHPLGILAASDKLAQVISFETLQPRLTWFCDFLNCRILVFFYSWVQLVPCHEKEILLFL